MKDKQGKKEIYILHEYGDNSHFKALYDEIDNYGYTIQDSIILSKKALIRKCLKSFLKNGDLFTQIKIYIKNSVNLARLKKTNNKTLIVGLAPYDRLLNKYKKIFLKNNSIYFTSWQYWDGTNFPKGSLKNKDSFEKILISNFRAAACVSKVTQTAVSNFFKYTEIVNHSIKVDEYKKKYGFRTDGKVKFLFLGQLIERKNINLIIDWIKNCTEYDFVFYFAGEGALSKSIERLSNEDSRVKYLGKVSKDQIKETLRDYDFMVLPSKEEPFGIVLIEALAAGIPCVVSNALGPSEIIKDDCNGFIFDKDQPEQFRKLMNNLLFISEESYRSMSDNCIIASYQYDTKNIVKNWIKVIDYVNENKVS